MSPSGRAEEVEVEVKVAEELLAVSVGTTVEAPGSRIMSKFHVENVTGDVA